MNSFFEKALLFCAILFLIGCSEKEALDHQMEMLCEQDGGSKVYEKVVLPADMFDAEGYPFPGWRDRLGKVNRLSDEYLYLEEEKIIKNGNPFSGNGEGKLWRSQQKIVRRSDSKLLGEFVGYYRAGGDGRLWFGHPSSNYCPKGSGVPIEKQVFIKR